MKARRTSEKLLSDLTSIMNEKRLYDLETAMIFYGSLARGEAVAGSDLDWTLLVDGQAKVNHEVVSDSIRNAIGTFGLEQPSKTGFFGDLTYSHDLVHYIGGEDDTNEIISKRMLYLLESGTVPVSNGSLIHNRIIYAIIENYILLDSTFKSKGGIYSKVPRLLLNDVVRFWRTMCVDFAYKSNRDGGKKWALRNIKLRMSRKLLFVKGLLMCYSCYENPSISTYESLHKHLHDLVLEKPLDCIVMVLKTHGIPDEIISELITAYDQFLELLDDKERREKLAAIPKKESYIDPDFIAAREITYKFQTNLQKAFFFEGSKLKTFTTNYCIF